MLICHVFFHWPFLIANNRMHRSKYWKLHSLEWMKQKCKNLMILQYLLTTMKYAILQSIKQIDMFERVSFNILVLEMWANCITKQHQLFRFILRIFHQLCEVQATPIKSIKYTSQYKLHNSIQLLTGSEDNSYCSRNQSITDLLYLIIFNVFYFNFFSCF